MADPVVVRVSAGDGSVVLSEPVSVDLDRLMPAAEVASLLGIGAATWRSYVGRGYAPRPVDPGDVLLPAKLRRPRWSLRQVQDYCDNRQRRWFRAPAG
jgi:hypothetical protein